MCVIFYTLSHPGYQLVLAANRDEFLDRPASDAEWHNFDSDSADKWVLCGRDLASADKGTWLGITKDLRVGILTNIRHPITPPPPNAPSRGRLLKSFLAPPPSDAPSVQDYLRTIDPDRYVGFNLLLIHPHKTESGWKQTDIGYISNRPKATIMQPDKNGCKGMSNSPWAEPYPKVVNGEKAMAATLAEWTDKGEDDDALVERMMTLLSPAPPINGINDMASATRVQPFQVGGNVDASENPTGQARWWGTRISTVILVRDDGHVVFVERDINVLDKETQQPIKGSAERKECFQAVLS